MTRQQSTNNKSQWTAVRWENNSVCKLLLCKRQNKLQAVSHWKVASHDECRAFRAEYSAKGQQCFFGLARQFHAWVNKPVHVVIVCACVAHACVHTWISCMCMLVHVLHVCLQTISITILIFKGIPFIVFWWVCVEAYSSWKLSFRNVIPVHL